MFWKSIQYEVSVVANIILILYHSSTNNIVMPMSFFLFHQQNTEYNICVSHSVCCSEWICVWTKQISQWLNYLIIQILAASKITSLLKLTNCIWQQKQAWTKVPEWRFVNDFIITTWEMYSITLGLHSY